MFEPNTLILANNQVCASYLISDSCRGFGPSFSLVYVSGLISLLGDITNPQSCFEPSNAFIYWINRCPFGVGNGQTPYLDNAGPHHALVIEQVRGGILPSLLCAPEFIPMRPLQVPLDAEVANQVLRFCGSTGFYVKQSLSEELTRGFAKEGRQ
ncbi:uncharacterized protein J3R85_015927 [Psidium guajava]|nr:uncharacterized protein J3R85_015927 [Psidium guajava]